MRVLLFPKLGCGPLSFRVEISIPGLGSFPNTDMDYLSLPLVPVSALRRQVHLRLPREYFAPCPGRSLIAAALLVGIAGLQTSSICFFTPGFCVVLISFCIGALHASLFFLGHEAGHG